MRLAPLGDGFDIPGGYGYEAPVDYALLDAAVAANTPGPTGGYQYPGIATNANGSSGLQALTSLTNAAMSRLVSLPGQGALAPGQTLTVGPGGIYQISAAGQAAGLTAGATLAGLSLPVLIALGLGAVLLLGKK